MSSGRRGLAILSFSLTTAVLVPFAGLALDFGMATVAKQRLQAAVESASHASARFAAGSEARERVAQRFFDANFPAGFMGTRASRLTVAGDLVQARTEAPTYFLKLVRIEMIAIAAAAPIGNTSAQ